MFQSSPAQQSQFSFHNLSLFTQLVQLSQSNINNSTNLNNLIKQLEESYFKTNSSKYDNLLFNFLKTKASSSQSLQNKDSSTSPLLQSFKNLLISFSQTKFRINNLDNLVQNIHQTKIIIADKKRLYSLKQEIAKKQAKNKIKNINITSSQNKIQKKFDQDQISYKAFIIYGKAINVQKHKKISLQTQQQPSTNISSDDYTSKQQTISGLQFCITKMYQQQKFPFIKSQPHQLQDLILTHSLDDSSLLPILVTHQVYRCFVPIEGAILLVIPEEIVQPIKQQIPFIIKNTVLHVYIDNYKLLSKIISKQSFFKNSTFRGIYFIEQGQVQTKSGRIVARGWVISGKCKSTTQAWRFTKTMAFFKFILGNQNIFKQFVNDLKLNNQWPLKISDILNIDQKSFQQLMGQEGAGFKLNSSNQRQKRLKFPPITARLNKSFDISKLSQIEKMKHFDQKMNHYHDYKQQMFKRKVQISSKKNSMQFQSQSVRDASQKQMNKRIQILSQKMNLPHKGLKTDISRSVILRPGQSSANILITGIVQKLKSMHENSASNSLQKSNNNKQGNINVKSLNRSRSKILGLKRYEQILKNQKSHLFKGKNFYN